MEAVAESSTIILLAKINRLNLLDVFDVCIPEKVNEEVLRTSDTAEKYMIESFLDANVKVVTVKGGFFGLGPGENQAIQLAVEKNAWFLSDDAKVRRAARIMGITTLGVLGVILIHVKEKTLSKKEAKSAVDDLLSNGAYLSTGVYAKFLDELNQV